MFGFYLRKGSPFINLQNPIIMSSCFSIGTLFNSDTSKLALRCDHPLVTLTKFYKNKYVNSKIKCLPKALLVKNPFPQVSHFNGLLSS